MAGNTGQAPKRKQTPEEVAAERAAHGGFTPPELVLSDFGINGGSMKLPDESTLTILQFATPGLNVSLRCTPQGRRAICEILLSQELEPEEKERYMELLTSGIHVPDASRIVLPRG